MKLNREDLRHVSDKNISHQYRKYTYPYSSSSSSFVTHTVNYFGSIQSAYLLSSLQTLKTSLTVTGLVVQCLSPVLQLFPQGVWMGWFTAAGSLARTVGPIYVSQIYDMSGPQATFASVAGLILLTTIFYLIVFRRLVPCKQKSQQDSGSPDRRTSA